MTPVEVLATLERLVTFNAHLGNDETVPLSIQFVRSVHEGFEQMASIIQGLSEENRHLAAHLSGEEHEHAPSEDGVQV